MPRQLPWLNKGAGNRIKVKQPPKPAEKYTLSDVDDGFFDGTVLASSSKASPQPGESGAHLPELSAEPSTPRTKSKTKDISPRNPLPSSSPPPIQDYIQPQIEPMRKGTSKFDLRDDEWMMVEDEFLETAKLFTRHLHIAEYEKLKERIEAKKREQVEAARPVVDEAKMLFEGRLKQKAKVQEKSQRKAIRDVFASQNEQDKDDDDEAFKRPASRKGRSSSNGSSRAASTTSKRSIKLPTTCDTEIDDLNASQPSPRTTTTPTAALASWRTTGPNSALHLQRNAAPANSTSSSAKPALPASEPKARTTTSRRSRATPFDMLDDYVPPTNPLPSQREARISQPITNSCRSSSSMRLTAASTNRTGPAVDVSGDWGSSKHGIGVSKETAEPLTKRKADREAAGKKNKVVKLDEIPTFLF